MSLTVNSSFAAGYEKRKRAEELTRYKQSDLEALGLLSDDSASSEDEDGQELSRRKSKRIDEVVAMIERKDPRIYDKNFRAFAKPGAKSTSGGGTGGSNSDSSDSSDGSSEEEVRGKRKAKPMYLRDHQRHMVMGGAMAEEEDEARASKAASSYPEQQQEAKAAFAAAVANDGGSGSGSSDSSDNDAEGSGSDDDLFTVKSGSGRTAAPAAAAAAAPPRRRTAEASASAVGHNDDDDAANAPKESDPEFLKRFMSSFAWRSMGGDFGAGGEDGEEEMDDVGGHDEVVDTADAFEHAYNQRFSDGSGAFHHDEQGNGKIEGHMRAAEGSVRRISGKREKRSRQRAEKRQRKEELKRAKLQELKRLKNMKRREIMRKLKEIGDVSGHTASGVAQGVDLEAEFDPAEHERQMNAIFGASYYDDEDDFVPEGQVGGGGGGGGGRGSASSSARASVVVEEEEEEVVVEEEEEEAPAPTTQHTRLKAAANAKLEKEFKGDYEDIIGGDLAVRFRYRTVVGNDYGLTTEEILNATDQELRQYVSTKRMAPFRSGEWSAPAASRKRLRSALKERKAAALAQSVRDKAAAAAAKIAELTGVPVAGEHKKRKRKRKRKASSEVTTPAATEAAITIDAAAAGGAFDAAAAAVAADPNAAAPFVPSVPTEEDPTGEIAQNAEQAEKRRKKKKKKVKKGSAEAAANGVSAARLAAYGLA